LLEDPILKKFWSKQKYVLWKGTKELWGKTKPKEKIQKMRGKFKQMPFSDFLKESIKIIKMD
jgi:hypothetical protein